MKYEQSSLYRSTLAAQDNDPYKDDRDMLRVAYQEARRGMIAILAQISKDFPNLTVHDITHVDALWNVASVIVGDSYSINPLEGFVLGCAFLVHDAALSYCTVGGEKALRDMPYWKDTYAEYKDVPNMSEDEKIKMTDFSTIREYHARKAADIIKKPIKTEKDDVFIIENSSLRNHLGDIIGKIAASHHWSIDQVAELPTQFNAPLGFDTSWQVNPQKLACILRCADAGHIDMGRAPDRLYQILHIHGLSANHWAAQNHLSMITVDHTRQDRAIITSSTPFKEEEFSAWNVAYDAVRVLDLELKASNALLAKHSPATQFAIKEIAGADSKSHLSKYIQTEGWTPCEANIHIDDVADIVMKLGGEALYENKNKLLVAVREMVQNARDAIYARTIQEKSFKAENGYIHIDISKSKNEVVVEVTDNGVGMSENVIKNVFLCFGKSLWYSSLVKSEYPGLKSSAFTPIGQYGIGFYSVFMVADEVVVETRQYNKATTSTIQLKFPNGLTLTPIMRIVDSNDTTISTKVTVKISPSRYEWKDEEFVILHYENLKACTVPLVAIFKVLFAGLDMGVYFSINHGEPQCIHHNIMQDDFDAKQWLRDISYADYRNEKLMDEYIENNYQRLERIDFPGKVRGLAAVNTLPNKEGAFLSIDTIGGLANLTNILSRDNQFYIGYLDYASTSASRNRIFRIEDAFIPDLKPWAKHQFELCKDLLTPEQKVYLPYLWVQLGVDSSEICMVHVLNPADGNVEVLSISEIIHNLKHKHEHLLFVTRQSLGTVYTIDTSIMYDKATVQAMLPDTDNNYKVLIPYTCQHDFIFLRVKPEGNTLSDYIFREAKKQNVIIDREEKVVTMKNGPYYTSSDLYLLILSCKK